ncbi:hypothetical protein OHA25_15210 [Nonomuraea sp. NBC_00507]|uniref:hypothetical protein n=1 Tax=Nonomuraea sp. NBC_00507 TaxID=2976002 RepID=UPI002E1897B9
MPDIGSILDGSLAIPFGLGHIPTWLLAVLDLLGLAVIIKIVSALVRGSRGRHGKPDHNERAALGSILGGVGQVVGTVVAICTLITTVWIWRDQVEREERKRLEEIQRQAEQSQESARLRLEEIQRQAQQSHESERREHAAFAARVSVLSYGDPAGMKIVIRNANSAGVSVLVLSLVGKRKDRQNVEIFVPPCNQASFLIVTPTSWTATVRKGGQDWLPGADPVLIAREWLFNTYGATDGKIYTGRVPATFEPIGMC